MLLGQAPPVNFISKPSRLDLQFQSHAHHFSFVHPCFGTKKLLTSVGNAVLVRAGYSHTPKDVLSWNPSTANDSLSSNLENSSDISILNEGAELRCFC